MKPSSVIVELALRDLVRRGERMANSEGGVSKISVGNSPEGVYGSDESSFTPAGDPGVRFLFGFIIVGRI